MDNLNYNNLLNLFIKYADNKYWKKWYEKNKDKFKKTVLNHNKKRREELQDLIIEKKNVPCIKCNNKFHYSAMNLVHRDSNTKEFSIRDATKSIYSKDKLLKELDKCDVICSNCSKLEKTNNVQEDSSRNRRRKKLQKIIDILKNIKCIDCGGSFPPQVMELDHLGYEKKTSSIAKMINEERPLKIIIKEVKKTEPICTNCHRIRTFNRRKETK